jgi:hypothetical protein
MLLRNQQTDSDKRSRFLEGIPVFIHQVSATNAGAWVLGKDKSVSDKIVVLVRDKLSYAFLIFTTSWFCSSSFSVHE